MEGSVTHGIVYGAAWQIIAPQIQEQHRPNTSASQTAHTCDSDAFAKATSLSSEDFRNIGLSSSCTATSSKIKGGEKRKLSVVDLTDDD